MRRAAAAAVVLLLARGAAADVVLTSENLNAALKTIERLARDARPGPAAADDLFQLATEADALAALLNAEVAAHGFQQRPLLDLALQRTRELGVGVAYRDDKRKYFYDCAAFEAYLRAQPAGPHALDATFKLIERDFYRTRPDDADAVRRAADRIRAFLSRHSRYGRNAEVMLFLAIDYRDLYRHYADRDPRLAARYGHLAERQLASISRGYPAAEHARIAREMLRRLIAERQSR
jgi:hypothetical protein